MVYRMEELLLPNLKQTGRFERMFLIQAQVVVGRGEFSVSVLALSSACGQTDGGRSISKHVVTKGVKAMVLKSLGPLKVVDLGTGIMVVDFS